MHELRRICVFCGTSGGTRPAYVEAAAAVGRFLAGRQIGVVYGGARVGMMGTVADAALAAGGQVYGVIPQALEELELTHHGLTELHVVSSMHERKLTMAEMADAFIALPGGWGTLEEIFEATTWTQLGFQAKPVGILNVHGYFDRMLDFLDHACAEGFIRMPDRRLLHAASAIEPLVDEMAAWRGA